MSINKNIDDLIALLIDIKTNPNVNTNIERLQTATNTIVDELRKLYPNPIIPTINTQIRTTSIIPAINTQTRTTPIIPTINIQTRTTPIIPTINEQPRLIIPTTPINPLIQQFNNAVPRYKTYYKSQVYDIFVGFRILEPQHNNLYHNYIVTRLNGSTKGFVIRVDMLGNVVETKEKPIILRKHEVYGKSQGFKWFFDDYSNKIVEAGIANNDGIKLRDINDPLLNATTQINYIDGPGCRYVEPKVGLIATFHSRFTDYPYVITAVNGDIVTFTYVGRTNGLRQFQAQIVNCQYEILDLPEDYQSNYNRLELGKYGDDKYNPPR